MGSIGKIRMYQGRDVPKDHENTHADQTDVIVRIIFEADSGRRNLALDKIGMDERFADSVLHAIEEEKSALITLMRYEDIADKDELIKVLNLFQGQIYQTTISVELNREFKEW
jgi:uncharacterized membrane protein